MIREILKHKIALLGLLFVSVLVYGQAFFFEYINYDDPYYLEKGFIVDGFQLADLKLLLKETGTNLWHPITWLSFYVDNWFSSASVSHGINVLFHALNSCLLFLLISRIPVVAKAALLVAVIHAIHPLHIESVAWVSARKDVLSLFFMLLSLLCFVNLKQRSYLSLLAALVFFLMALMSKPIAVITPVFMLAIFFGSNDKSKRPIIVTCLFSIISLMFCFLTLWIHRESANAELLLNAGRVDKMALVGFNYLYYFYKFFIPTNLSFFYPHGGSLPLYIYGGYLTFLLSILALVGLRFKKLQKLSALWLIYMLSYAPAAGFITIGDAIRADRYMYIPAIFIALIGFELIATLSSQLNKHFQSAMYAVIGLWIGLVIVVGQVYLGKWKSNQTLYTHALKLNSSNYLAYHNLATAQAENDQHEQALSHYQEVLKLKPTYKAVRYRMAQIYQHLGQFSRAETLLTEEYKLHPTPENLLSLAYNFYLNHKFQDCVDFISKQKKQHSELRLLKALSLQKLKNYAKAIEQYSAIPAHVFSDSDTLSYAYCLLATNQQLEAKKVLTLVKNKKSKSYQSLSQMINR